MLKFGSNNIGKVYLGNNPIGKAYYGSNLVYQSGETPTPPTPPTPSEPVFYDFLIFDGTAYIDTSVIPPSNATFKVAIRNETLKAAQRCFMCTAENSTYVGMRYGSSTDSSNRRFEVYYGTSSVAGTKTLNFQYATFNFLLTPYRLGFGTNTETYTKGDNAPNGGIVLGSNVAHTGQPFTGSMGTFYIYGSDAQNVTQVSDLGNYTPVATLRPCMYGSEAGMWYVEGNTFYGNSAGSGTLTVANNE